MNHDPDSQARLIHHPDPLPVRVKKSSWWQCFFASLGMSLLAVALLWIYAALTTGVPIPMAGHDARGFTQLDGALIALFFYMLLILPIPLAIGFLSAITARIGVSRYPAEPFKARRLAMVCAFLMTLIIWGICQPGFLRYMHAS